MKASKTYKMCSYRGFIDKALKYERVWRCPNCGATLDRDVNAARDILAKSLLKRGGSGSAVR